jgi:hypothetical protein
VVELKENNKMTTEEIEFENETRKHQQRVAYFMSLLARKIIKRANTHDASKLQSPERELFCKTTAKLKGLTYGSDEYKKSLEELGPALSHHYSYNGHHPEYFRLNCYETVHGMVGAMDIVDLLEMICDWLAATDRHADGDISKSIQINRKRFNFSDDVVGILEQTVGLVRDLEFKDTK